jgi:hypothetical protein
VCACALCCASAVLTAAVPCCAVLCCAAIDRRAPWTLDHPSARTSWAHSRLIPTSTMLGMEFRHSELWIGFEILAVEWICIPFSVFLSLTRGWYCGSLDRILLSSLLDGRACLRSHLTPSHTTAKLTGSRRCMRACAPRFFRAFCTTLATPPWCALTALQRLLDSSASLVCFTAFLDYLNEIET